MHFGRCIQRQEKEGSFPIEISLQNQNGVLPLKVLSGETPGLGDWVQVDPNGNLKILTRCGSQSWKWTERVLDPKRIRTMKIRSEVEKAIRDFFLKEDFLETRTPLLVPCPGMEPHIRPFKLISGAYLPTSPEFAMKRLLVGGLERIFQLCPSFRNEPPSQTHHPEFMMLEWYRAFCGYESIMKDTENLFLHIARQVLKKDSLSFQGTEIDLKTPWERLEVRTLFREKVGVELACGSPVSIDEMRGHCTRLGLSFSESDLWDDLYFRIWLNFIEPTLPKNRPVIVSRYPASQAALAVTDIDSDGSRWAKRFEVYAGGLELGNAFQELTDPVEQRRRFTEDMDLREAVYGNDFEKTPLDEEFLHALDEGMPPASGIAMGIDRIVMLFSNEPDIDQTLWLSSQS